MHIAGTGAFTGLLRTCRQVGPSARAVLLGAGRQCPPCSRPLPACCLGSCGSSSRRRLLLERAGGHGQGAPRHALPVLTCAPSSPHPLLQQILAEDGVAGFYRGCMTNLLRTTPAAAVTFTSFEVINRQLKLWAETPAAPPASAHQRQQQRQAAQQKQQRQQRGAATAAAEQQQEQQQGQGQVGRAAVAHHAEPGAEAAAERTVGPLFAAASSAAASGGGGSATRDPRQLSSHTRSLEDGGEPRR